MVVRCPSAKALCATFRHLEPEQARLIRKLAKAVDERDKLAKLIEDHVPATHAYARSCYNDPFDSGMWRRTMALHAIDVIVGTCGVEPLGPRDWDGRVGPPWEYLNAGDPYVATLIYTRATDTLRIGSWGDIVERHDRKGEW